MPPPPLPYAPRSPPPPPPKGPDLSVRPARNRPFLMAVAIVALVVTGSKYGADLKEERDGLKEAKKLRAAAPAERIEYLQHRKSVLMTRKAGLESKIEELRDRQREKTEIDEKRGLRVEEAGGRGVG